MKVLSGDAHSVFGIPPPGLSEARAKMQALVSELQTQTGLPLSRFVFAGFSQGKSVCAHLVSTSCPLSVLVCVTLFVCAHPVA